MTDNIARIPMVPEEQYYRDEYGITHRSEHVYDVRKGTARFAPHRGNYRVKLWDNTIRPNVGPLYGPDANGPMGHGKIGPGAYVGPFRNGTDDVTTYSASGEGVMISAVQIGPRTTYGEPFAIGDRVRFTFPNGSESQTHVVEYDFNNGVTFRAAPEATDTH